MVEITFSKADQDQLLMILANTPRDAPASEHKAE